MQLLRAPVTLDTAGDTVAYTSKEEPDGPDSVSDGANLNCDHTHFVLVDAPAKSWGAELELRAQVEKLYAELLGVRCRP